MRLVTFSTDGDNKPRPGVEVVGPHGTDVLDVGVAVRTIGAPELRTTVADLLSPAARSKLEDLLLSTASDSEVALANGSLVPQARTRLHAPLGRKTSVLCAGGNYRSHLAEMGDDVPAMPLSFFKSSNAVIGPGDPIVLPRSHRDHVDFEAELCAVFGRVCHRVAAEEALDYVSGYTLINDVSARDAIPQVQSATTADQGRDGWTLMLLGKQFPTFCPMGPVVVTSDEIDDPQALRIGTTLSGDVMQDCDTSDMVVGVAGLIEAFSRYVRFEPGDVLSTGSGPGVGVARTPQRFMRHGDVVETWAEQIGTLQNPVVDESPEGPD